MKLIKELNEAAGQSGAVVAVVKEIIDDGTFYDSDDKEQKGVTYEDLKYFLKMKEISRIPSAVSFQSALNDAGMNIKVVSGKRRKGKGKSLNFWMFKK